MDFKKLQALGAVVSKEPVVKTVTWQGPDGEDITFDLHVRRQPYGDFTKIIDTKDKVMTAELLANCLIDPDTGENMMTYDQAYQLETSMATVMLNAIFEVNVDKKKSPQKKSSGTSSSSQGSAATPSPKQKQI